MTFEFYDNNKKIGEFSFHHWSHIRIRSDIVLIKKSQESIKQWLRSKNVTEERLEKILEDYMNKENADDQELIETEELEPNKSLGLTVFEMCDHFSLAYSWSER